MDNDSAASAAATMGVLLFECIGFVVFYGIGGLIAGKIIEKAGKPMWIGWVPIYNLLTLLEIVGRPVWWIVLFILPFVSFVAWVLLAIDIAKAFGKDVLYGIGLCVPCVNLVLLLMLAFGDARYIGPPNIPA